MRFTKLNARVGDYIIVKSDTWFVYDVGGWREMTIEEQIEASE